MKKMFLPFLFVFVSIAGMAQYMKYSVHTTANLTFSPDSIMVMPMDTVIFTIGGIHNLTEVDSMTWAMNGTTALPGGAFIASGMTDTLIFDTTGVFYYVCTPHVGVGMKGKIVIMDMIASLPTSSTLANGIKIYPNPVQSNVTVQFPQAMEVESIRIVNAQGSEVSFTSVRSVVSSQSLQIDHLEKGIYQVLISSSGKRFVGKIVKQ